MKNKPNQILEIKTTDGVPFIVYQGQEGAVHVERLRPDGKRGTSSLFEFNAAQLIECLVLCSAEKQT
jgi:hypothetical protein